MANEFPINLGNIIAIVENRAKIAGGIQEEDRQFIIQTVNEYHASICTERPWRWRKFDRAFVMSPALAAGTANCVNNSREVEMDGLVLVDPSILLGRSFKVSADREMYRIIGVRTAPLRILLEAPYVGQTGNGKAYKIYEYEFALPPDCDTVDQVYIDSTFGIAYGTNTGELDYTNVLEFNRLLSINPAWIGDPFCYTEDSETFFNNSGSVPPLDVMVLNYDFLGGNSFSKTKRIRIYPLESNRQVLIHLNYTKQVPILTQDADIPLIQFDDRWVLVHYALYEWNKHNGSSAQADRELKAAEKKLQDMRNEFIKTDTKPQFIFDARRYRRVHGPSNRRYLHWISRQAETGG